jgi:hypothetical protein
MTWRALSVRPYHAHEQVHCLPQIVTAVHRFQHLGHVFVRLAVEDAGALTVTQLLDVAAQVELKAKIESVCSCSSLKHSDTGAFKVGLIAPPYLQHRYHHVGTNDFPDAEPRLRLHRRGCHPQSGAYIRPLLSST